MRKFCKVFEDPEIGQVLVVNDDDEEGNPSVTFSVTPKGLGVCSIGHTFKSTDKGYEQCDAYFESIGINKALKTVKKILDIADEASKSEGK